MDGYNFYKDYTMGQSLEARKLAAYAGDERTVVDLLIDQIEFADGKGMASGVRFFSVSVMLSGS